MIVGLTADVTVGSGQSEQTYEAGTVLEYSNGAWALYTGYTTAV
jgi:hypothetical protein